MQTDDFWFDNREGDTRDQKKNFVLENGKKSLEELHVFRRKNATPNEGLIMIDDDLKVARLSPSLSSLHPSCAARVFCLIRKIFHFSWPFLRHQKQRGMQRCVSTSDSDFCSMFKSILTSWARAKILIRCLQESALTSLEIDRRALRQVIRDFCRWGTGGKKESGELPTDGKTISVFARPSPAIVGCLLRKLRNQQSSGFLHKNVLGRHEQKFQVQKEICFRDFVSQVGTRFAFLLLCARCRVI